MKLGVLARGGPFLQRLARRPRRWQLLAPDPLERRHDSFESPGPERLGSPLQPAPRRVIRPRAPPPVFASCSKYSPSLAFASPAPPACALRGWGVECRNAHVVAPALGTWVQKYLVAETSFSTSHTCLTLKAHLSHVAYRQCRIESCTRRSSSGALGRGLRC